MKGPRWKPHEDDLLRAHYRQQGHDALAAQLNRPASGIRQRARRLGLAAVTGPAVPWPPAHTAELRRDYGRVPTAELARRFGRTERAVREQARTLGLYHPRLGARLRHAATERANRQAAALREAAILLAVQRGALTRADAAQLRLPLEVTA